MQPKVDMSRDSFCVDVSAATLLKTLSFLYIFFHLGTLENMAQRPYKPSLIATKLMGKLVR